MFYLTNSIYIVATRGITIQGTSCVFYKTRAIWYQSCRVNPSGSLEKPLGWSFLLLSCGRQIGMILINSVSSLQIWEPLISSSLLYRYCVHLPKTVMVSSTLSISLCQKMTLLSPVKLRLCKQSSRLLAGFFEGLCVYHYRIQNLLFVL